MRKDGGVSLSCHNTSQQPKDKNYPLFLQNHIIAWELYNKGCCDVVLFHRSGKVFQGNLGEFFAEHQNIVGLKNKLSKMVVLVNYYGEIAGRTETRTNT